MVFTLTLPSVECLFQLTILSLPDKMSCQVKLPTFVLFYKFSLKEQIEEVYVIYSMGIFPNN